jgi:nucleoside-diphosphate-sugar epimerase
LNRVLVTGASGFVGRNALTPLLEQGFDVHAVARTPLDVADVAWHAADLLEPTSLDALVDEVRPSHLLHLAWYAVHRDYWTSPENERWVSASTQLLRRFGAAGGTRAVIAGTCAEYDWSYGICIERETPLAPASAYGVAKDTLRRGAEALATEGGFSLAWGRIFFLYGPHEQPERLVPSVTRALLAGDPAPPTHRDLVRDFLHVHDAGAAFAALLGSSVEGPVNVGSGTGTRIRDVVHAVAHAAARPELVRDGPAPSSPPGAPSVVADIRRLEREVGWRPSLSLAAGIEQTVGWWRDSGA